MEINTLSVGEVDEAASLIEKSFSLSVAPTLTEEGARRFRSGATSESILKRLVSGNIFVACKINRNVIGVAEVRDGNHLNLLFVDPAYQSRGVGKAIIEEIIRRIDHDVITVNSSVNSIEVYHSMGFVTTGIESVAGGIRYIPMVRNLS